MTDAIQFNKRVIRGLRSAYEGARTGALICQTAEAKRLVFFENGYLVGAKSELPRERLGEIMVAEGRITRDQLEEATGFIRSGRKLGRILVELGFLKSGEIETYVRQQILLIAGSMLMSVPERLVFSTAVPVEAVTLSPISIGDVFLAAASHLTDLQSYRKSVLLDDYVLARTSDASALAGQMKLDPEEARVLDLVDESNTVGDILAAARLPEERTMRLLLAMHQAGIVSLERKRAGSAAAGPRPAPAPPPAADPFEKELIAFFNEMQCRNHWQVLGLERDAGYSEIDRAYRELANRFDPERYQHISDADFQEKLSSVRARLKEAFAILCSRTSTNAYDRLVEREGSYEEKKESWEAISPSTAAPPASAAEDWERPKSAEESKALFAKAKRAYREQDFWRTIELCRASIELAPDPDAERFHLLGMALAENPRWRQDAEKNLKIAHNLKPWEPRYLVSMAQLYEKVGLHQRAQRLYEQVRVLNPGFPIGEEAEARAATHDLAEGDDLEKKRAV